MKIRSPLLLALFVGVCAIAKAAEEPNKSEKKYGNFSLVLDMPGSLAPNFQDRYMPYLIRFVGRSLISEGQKDYSYGREELSFLPAFITGSNQYVYIGKAPADFNYEGLTVYRYPYENKDFAAWTNGVFGKIKISGNVWNDLGSIKVVRPDSAGGTVTRGLLLGVSATGDIAWSSSDYSKQIASNLAEGIIASDIPAIIAQSELKKSSLSVLAGQEAISLEKYNEFRRLGPNFSAPAELNGEIVVPNDGGPFVVRRSKSGKWALHKFSNEASFTYASFSPKTARPILATANKLYLANFEKNELKEINLPDKNFIRMLATCNQVDCMVVLQDKKVVKAYHLADVEEGKWSKPENVFELAENQFIDRGIFRGKSIFIPILGKPSPHQFLIGESSDKGGMSWREISSDNYILFDEGVNWKKQPETDFRYSIKKGFLSRKFSVWGDVGADASEFDSEYDIFTVYLNRDKFFIEQTFNDNIFVKEKDSSTWKNVGVGAFKLTRFYRDETGIVYGFGEGGKVVEMGQDGSRWKVINME
jgi:hypothetical protein